MSVTHPNENQAVKTGATAPDFSLFDTNKQLYTLSMTTAVQPVILVFYRGDW